jgi:hypothetical protein
MYVHFQYLEYKTNFWLRNRQREILRRRKLDHNLSLFSIVRTVPLVSPTSHEAAAETSSRFLARELVPSPFAASIGRREGASCSSVLEW